ncbi:MAG: septum formation protein Maf [Lachnospiraceae bacterium]|nr:septum formation protein Maf [Lachnospiraceae bacterium]
MRVILASGSARRRELLKLIIKEYEVIPSASDENIGCYPPEDTVMRLSEMKAQDVFDRVDDSLNELLVIGSDTVVALDDAILGKPASEEEAFDMLKSLKNRAHKVFTGVTLIMRDRERKVTSSTFYEETLVFVSDMTDEEIRAYVKTGEPMDKAGAYGIQTEFARYVTGIEGDYQNVVGLPVAKLYAELKDMEVIKVL